MSAVSAIAGLEPRRLEEATQTRARELLALAGSEHGKLTAYNRWTGAVIDWCLADPSVKVRLLQFIDCLPALPDAASVVRHLREYFPSDDLRLPRSLRVASGLAGAGLTGPVPAAFAIRKMAERVARQFVAAESPSAARALVDRLAADGLRASVDILGEDVLGDREADRYLDDNLDLIDRLAGAPFAQISVKASGLAPRFEPPGVADALARAAPRFDRIRAAAAAAGVEVVLDAESCALRDLTFALAAREAGRFPPVGIVVQAYLRDAGPAVLDAVAAARSVGVPLPVRLVKGAYWDHEIAVAAQADRPPPVWTDKWETDRAFERLTERLLARHQEVRVAIASHNLRSLAHALATADALGLPPGSVEFQFLFGMGEALAGAMLALGRPVRMYAPVGELLPGMGYLVRRLLENTANESFLRLGAAVRMSPEDAARPPGPPPAHPGGNGSRPPRRRPAPGFAGPSRTRFEDPDRREAFLRALDLERGAAGGFLPMLVGARHVDGGRTLESRNPAHPGEIVARVAVATAADAGQAVAAARDALPGWRAAGFTARAGLLRRAADLLEAERDRLAALEILEVGRTWAEADADVVEAITHLRYAADRGARFASGPPLDGRPGEANRGVYEPLGPAAVIAPWNFPLAIPAGMAASALAAGNPVMLKPSSLAPATAYRLVRALRAAGVPPGAIQYLPGAGPDAGMALVRHPDVPLVMFTGSRDAGLAILAAVRDPVPGGRVLKQAVVELGGKNAVIVDDDADLDAAVAGITVSAFGYAGQKCSACSRVIAVGAVAEPLFRRLAAAADALRVDDPALPSADLGPVITADALERLLRAGASARARGRVVFDAPAERLPGEGWYVNPLIVGGLEPGDPLAREELFGPLLCVFSVPSFEVALDLALDSDYALTGGVYSRSPAHLAAAADRFVVGDLYLNRAITGAAVGRQPFGGWRLSGLGTQAGGPDFLVRLVRTRVVCENTARHGMPLEAG